jgi:hypothetical protein
MTETEWAKKIAEILSKELQGYGIEPGKSLLYANEIKEYGDNGNIYNNMAYETDILVYQKNKDNSWIPRVVIETKINTVTTHDAITYSQKAATHKYVHPYLRYGIFLGYRKEYPLPGRLFRHGAHFDFMISWKCYEPKPYELEKLIEIINSEIEASKTLEEMIFNSRRTQRNKYFSLHKPLITTSQN